MRPALPREERPYAWPPGQGKAARTRLAHGCVGVDGPGETLALMPCERHGRSGHSAMTLARCSRV
ncbi:MAG TPA: hypothetical protein VIM86_04660, partial [Thermodesulfobacteriota bacterium]